MAREHLIDPELKPILDLFPPLQLSRDGLPELRSMMAKMLAAGPVPSDLSVSTNVVTIPGPTNSPPLRVMCYRIVTRA